MFRVSDVRTGKVRTVYAVSGTLFLLYGEEGWFCDDMRNYVPEGGSRDE